MLSMDDGVRLWTTTSGSGLPMVLCHGGPGMWDNLGGLAALVEPLARVHRWDQRGCGRSDRVGPYTVERQVRDMEAIRAHEGIDRWVVAGHSWGATLALHYAAARPDRARALILLSGTGLADSWATSNRATYHAERSRRLSTEEAARRDELATRPDRTGDEEREFRLLSWMTDLAPNQSPNDVLREDLDAPWSVNRTANRALNADTARLAGDLRAALPCLHVPALVLHGVHDPRPLDGPAELAALLPRAELVTLPSGHQPWTDAPDELGGALRTFLARLDRR